jgi:hypothetical protein
MTGNLRTVKQEESLTEKVWPARLSLSSTRRHAG